MPEKLGNEPAYPCEKIIRDCNIDGVYHEKYKFINTGMTVRQEFAKAAMQGIVSALKGEAEYKDIAKGACLIADALLAEEERTRGGDE